VTYRTNQITQVVLLIHWVDMANWT